MTSISNDPTLSQPSAASNLVGLQSQLETLQRQCADWQNCATTPAADKEKIVGALTDKIQSIQQKMSQLQGTTPTATINAVAAPAPSEKIPADGTNRPIDDPFAISGSQLNTSI